MTKRLEAKYKKYRRAGSHLSVLPETKWLKHIKKSTPGEHGVPFTVQNAKNYQDLDFGKQLSEKQKLRLAYGNMTDKQFKHVYTVAAKSGQIEQTLIPTLERRLQTIIFRAGFAKTFYSARQLINHGHILVDGQIVRLSNYLVKVGEIIQLAEKRRFEEALINHADPHDVPHLEINLKLMAATLTTYPEYEDRKLRLIREYYK